MTKGVKILSIAGHDPSGGAGIAADIKTFMHFGLQDLSICTALTIQDENQFKDVVWVEQKVIDQQLRLMFASYSIPLVKIGLIKSISSLNETLELILRLSPDTKIIWDPILSASAGFVFHKSTDANGLLSCLSKLEGITPNLPEKELLEQWSGVNMKNWPVDLVALKGGHSEGQTVVDQLWLNGELVKEETKERIDKSIHGSGCIFSSALAAGLAKGNSVETAFESASRYIEELMTRTTSRLAPQYEL